MQIVEFNIRDPRYILGCRVMSSTSLRILELLEQGYSPREIVRMGYPKSTVYYVYRRYRSRKGPLRTVYVAHDTGRFERLIRLQQLLESLGYSVRIGPWESTMDIRSMLRDVDVVVGITDARPSLRHELFLREIEMASRMGKRVVVVAEKGAVIRTAPRVPVVTFSNDPQELRTSLEKLLRRLGSENSEDILMILGVIAIAAIAAMGLVALLNLIMELLTSKNTR